MRSRNTAQRQRSRSPRSPCPLALGKHRVSEDTPPRTQRSLSGALAQDSPPFTPLNQRGALRRGRLASPSTPEPVKALLMTSPRSKQTPGDLAFPSKALAQDGSKTSEEAKAVASSSPDVASPATVRYSPTVRLAPSPSPTATVRYSPSSLWARLSRELDEEEAEELEEVPFDEKAKDLLYQARVIIPQMQGGLLEGVVVNVDRARRSRELLYRVEYKDGDFEHMNAARAQDGKAIHAAFSLRESALQEQSRRIAALQVQVAKLTRQSDTLIASCKPTEKPKPSPPMVRTPKDTQRTRNEGKMTKTMAASQAKARGGSKVTAKRKVKTNAKVATRRPGAAWRRPAQRR